MTDKSPTDHLVELRGHLVADRRRIAEESLFYRAQNISAPSGGELIRSIQEQIEAIDRAIADEASFQPSVYETRGVVEV